MSSTPLERLEAKTETNFIMLCLGYIGLVFYPCLGYSVIMMPRNLFGIFTIPIAIIFLLVILVVTLNALLIVIPTKTVLKIIDKVIDKLYS